MAVRGWTGPVTTAIGVAAGTGAAQLGFGYGLGIIVWLPSADGASDASWVASLAWATWIAATATIAGAICAARLARPPIGTAAAAVADPGATRTTGPADPDSAGPVLSSWLWRVTLAVAAAIGALVTVALIAVPARAATRADTFSPQAIAAGYAVIGIMIGLLAAIWALSSPAVASNIILSAGWLWLLAVVAVIEGVLSGRGLTAAQLGVWQLTSNSSIFWYRDYFYWPGALLTLGSALFIGMIAARSAARLTRARVGATISGVAGPLLVAAAYFLAAPRLVGAQAEQVSAHLMAPYAVVAGLIGSALMAALAQRAEQRRAERRTRQVDDTPSEPATDPNRTDHDQADRDRPGRGQADSDLTGRDGSEQGASKDRPTGGRSKPDPMTPSTRIPAQPKSGPGESPVTGDRSDTGSRSSTGGDSDTAGSVTAGAGTTQGTRATRRARTGKRASTAADSPDPQDPTR